MSETKVDPEITKSQTVRPFDGFDKLYRSELAAMNTVELRKAYLGSWLSPEEQIDALALDNARLTSAHASATAEWAEMYCKLSGIQSTMRAIIELANAEPPAGMDEHTHNKAKVEAIKRIAREELERVK